MARIGGIDWGEVSDIRGDFNLGFNATGVVESSIHFTGDEIIIRESMPAAHVQTIMDSVDALAHRIRTRRPGGDLVGQIPITIWYAWRNEWKRGPKQHGVLWRAFFRSKFMDRDFSKFRAGKL